MHRLLPKKGGGKIIQLILFCKRLHNCIYFVLHKPTFVVSKFAICVVKKIITVFVSYLQSKITVCLHSNSFNFDSFTTIFVSFLSNLKEMRIFIMQFDYFQSNLKKL